MFGGDAEKAWRTVCVVPAVIGIITGGTVILYADDSPKGNYSELKARGLFPPMSVAASFKAAASDFNTWVLAVQYACSFGMELTMTSAAALYFHEVFGLSREAAAAIASVFGWLNLFARGLGGALSDMWMQRYGMRGRLWIQTICLIGEGIFVLVFSHSKSLGGSIVSLVIFSLFVQAADGTCFGIGKFDEELVP
jgi:MFS transporter, NNP family, nitrate/nitrite transporter